MGFFNYSYVGSDCLDRGYLNRLGTTETNTKGIGWQFIRYTVLSLAIPIIAILTLNGALSSERLL